LLTLSVRDPDLGVRDEAAIAALALGADAAHEPVAAFLARADQSADGLLLKRRASLALAPRKETRATAWLSAWACDATAQETDRLHAIVALGQLGDPSAVAALVSVLPEVRLREATAQALAQIGGQAAQDALFEALRNERYEPGRAAEAAALIKLGDKRVLGQIERFLGMETSIPSGVRMLLGLGALELASARGASRRGVFQCHADGCLPGQGARIVLPPRSGPRAQRITLLIASSQPGATLRVGAASYRCAGGEQQLSFVRPEKGADLPIESDGSVSLIAWVSVPQMPEIPPPAPEPWDAGADSDADAAAR
jgi:hypothetical protein